MINTVMQIIVLRETDPAINLALEECLLKFTDGEYTLLYRNSTSVICGKHQNLLAEADVLWCHDQDIPMFRRMSGGGTVVHDEGNLNFSFIRNAQPGYQVDFRKQTEPVIRFLAELGLEASFGGHNDIRSGGLKISGNAEHVYRNRVLHHGTLLFDSDLDRLDRCLLKGTSTYTGRAVPSVPALVGNTRTLLDTDQGIETFMKQMASSFCASFDGRITTAVPEGFLEQARQLAAEKYHSKEWIFGYSPAYSMSNSGMYNGESAGLRLEARKGRIESATLEIGRGTRIDITGTWSGQWHSPDNADELCRLSGAIAAIGKEELRTLLF